MKKMKSILKKNTKGQTALEYALVVGAISLVVMGAWNVVGKSVQESIKGSLLGGITDQIVKGNNTFKK